MTNILLHIFAFIGVYFTCVTAVFLFMQVISTIQYRIQERRRRKEEEKKAKEVYDRMIEGLKRLPEAKDIE